ncbi:MAG TPA: tRNA (N6-isopentenyl adenosine(37)-C2)-methylthiotransferase MiaB [Perlabentimonas sp.]|nr:tRNA (N6-isopentenyl adenosine(37)-C2)-methylthiotransferase MiaB [Bacteroidales bacterium]MDD4671788.1 tRNA (N6-isopentenyl adenosine(37)-C2)-methylthiotransferase MiaB [Bacteroidales bacterium]MDY0347352.1 tRNA (N6-isopentenyl adenosine(37)-C2)-methylthiotransferase MiaB [Tenuifilaceae bacterium]HZJ74453.1 tRNA (N6-isopentenyl adenosine(37)-C2)-methylthiotransferase MiaB [Perlabentimonas sp.]
MTDINNTAGKFYIETYGCQMNFSDSEVVASILSDNGYTLTRSIDEADIILVNTCSIRENAETRVWGRLDVYRLQKKEKPSVLIGVLGCMAERLKEKLLSKEKLVDIVVGPDAYRDLPTLLQSAKEGQEGINVLLSREETYADINPVRLDKNGVSAFVSIMRGCNNMCTYCVVPYVRGAERSRDPETIIREVKELINNGYKEVTLLGQNVDSYNWVNGENKKVGFAELLEMVAKVDHNIRVRFSTSHPKDLSDDVLYTMAMYENICDHIHLPVQSGSSRVLDLMNRGYSREYYMGRIEAIRRILPSSTISTDMITGFCAETEEDHEQTLSLMEWVGYDFAYMFKYSERPNTKAARRMQDDVPEDVKARRLTEIIELQNKLSEESKKKDIGKRFKVLVEGVSKKSDEQFYGRTSQNKVVVFPKEDSKIGDYVFVKVHESTQATLIGTISKS